MESKLNFKALDEYADTCAVKLIENLYTQKKEINGHDLLALPVPQVGFFILHDIQQSWALEADRLRSPYFDYQNEAVKSNLDKLMNVLSKHILVAKENLQPMVRPAIYRTLLLVFSPYTFYKELVAAESFTIEWLNGIKKFIKVNHHVLDKLIESPELAIADGNGLQKLIDQIFSELEEEPQNNDTTVEQFSKLIPLNPAVFYSTKEGGKIDAKEFDDEDDEKDITTTLNASFVENTYETIGDTLKNNQGNNSLKSMLSINQKFMFINDLFNGNQDDFTKVLEFLEGCDTKTVAINFIQNNYLKHNIWNANAPQVKEFIALIDKKFA